MSLLNDSHKELIEAAKNNGLVIFAGAGISKSAGLPLWGELIEIIIHNINNNNPDEGEILATLYRKSPSESKIFKVLNYIEASPFVGIAYKTLSEEIYKSTIKFESLNTPLPLHSKLWKVSKKIITPNYDNLFELCVEYKEVSPKLITNKSVLDLANISSFENFLLKIHGTISEIDDIVFFKSQYDNQYNKATGITNRFQDLVGNKPILFVGTSMTDPYINEIIHQVNSIFHYTSAGNFMLSNENFQNAEIIRIPGDPRNDLESLLDELLSLRGDKLKPIIADTTVLEKPKITESKNKLNLYTKPKQYFTGRDKEIEDFKKAIDAGNTFIAIDGAGGIGKTQFVTKCIEKYIPHEKVMWFDCKPESQFDTLISCAGYPELLEGSSKTDREIFSAFKDKLQDNEFFLFLDNFQETNSKPVFKEFLQFIQDYLKRGCLIVIDRDDITTLNLTPKRIHIEAFKEKKLSMQKH